MANIKFNGHLGGIVWNRTTGNLVDGHRRVLALDIIHKNDGTAATDYTLKVEVVEFDCKTELEQLTYMVIGNSKADYNLVAQYAGQIDTKAVGLSDEDYQQQTATPHPQVPRYTLNGDEQTFADIEL